MTADTNLTAAELADKVYDILAGQIGFGVPTNNATVGVILGAAGITAQPFGKGKLIAALGRLPFIEITHDGLVAYITLHDKHDDYTRQRRSYLAATDKNALASAPRQHIYYARYVRRSDSGNTDWFKKIDYPVGLNNLYVSIKATEHINLSPADQGQWFWITTVDGAPVQFIYRPDTSGGGAKREAESFMNDYQAGDTISRPVNHISPAGNITLSITADWQSEQISADDLTAAGISPTDCQPGDIITCQIDNIDRDDGDLHVKLTPLRYYTEPERQRATPLPRQSPKVYVGRSLIDELAKEPWASNLESSIGAVLGQSSLGDYLAERYNTAVGDGKVYVKHVDKKDGTILGISLDIPNEFGVPLAAEIKWPQDAKDSFYAWRIRPISATAQLTRDVAFVNFDAAVQSLADLATAEQWQFTDSQSSEPNHVLSQYLRMNYYKAKLDGLVYSDAAGRGDVIFNTGLVDDLYNDIYCYLINNHSGTTGATRPWRYGCFACAGQGPNGIKINALFSQLPPAPQYIDAAHAADLFFNPTAAVEINYEHITKRLERLPWDFIVSLARSASNQTLYDKIYGHEISREDTYVAIAASDELQRLLKERLDQAKDNAIRRCRLSYHTAVPIYYAEENNISLLLPLDVSAATDGADVALLIERLPSGNYQGRTILTIEQAYQDARQICRLDDKWLTIH